MRRREHPSRFSASLAALAFVVPLSIAGPVVVAEAAPATASPTTLALSLSTALTAYGRTVTATIAGADPTGPVEVLLDGTVVAAGPPTPSGTAEVPLPTTVAAGIHTVRARSAVDGSATADRPLTVTKVVPGLRTDDTDWSIRSTDAKLVHVQVTGVAGIPPTGDVVVWVNGARRGSAVLDRSGAAVVHLPRSTRTALVVVTYGGDRGYLPWVVAPHLLIVR